MRVAARVRAPSTAVGALYVRRARTDCRCFSDKPGAPKPSPNNGAKSPRPTASSIFTVRAPPEKSARSPVTVSELQDQPLPRPPPPRTLTWFKKLFKPFLKGSDMRESAMSMGETIRAHCTNPLWHQQCGIPEDHIPLLALRALHVWIVHQRINEDMKDGTDVLVYRLYESLWEDFEDEMENAGVMFTSKLLQKCQGLVYGGLRAYDKTLDAAVQTNDYTAYLGALWRNLFMAMPELNRDHLVQLRDYVVEQRMRIREIPESEFYEGRISFSLPGPAARSPEADRVDPAIALKPMYNAGPEGSDSSFIYERNPLRTIMFERHNLNKQ